MGKLKSWISIKSLTPPYTILSIKFPIVPASKSPVIQNQICFLLYNRTIAHIPTILIPIIILNGTGNDREIPVLSAGVIKRLCSRYFTL